MIKGREGENNKIGTDVDKNTEQIPRMIMTTIGYAVGRRANEWKGSRKLNQRGFEKERGEQINQYLDNKKNRRAQTGSLHP